MSYVTVAEFRGAGSMPMIAQATPSAIPDGEVETLIENASRLFDLECGVEPGYFEAAGVSVTNRTFYGNGTRFLKVGRYVPGSLNTAITLPEGYTVPDFIERDGEYLVITDSGGVVNGSSRCYGEGWLTGVPIIISAKWGFEVTPPPVKQAVIKWAVELWRITDPANQKLLAIEGQPISPQRIPPFVQSVAKHYRVQNGVMV